MKEMVSLILTGSRVIGGGLVNCGEAGGSQKVGGLPSL
jgi:hypothetical protein